MNDNSIEVEPLDVAALSPDDVASLGDCALGHAVRRRLALGSAEDNPEARDLIAAFESHV
jgi:hypothetical protein